MAGPDSDRPSGSEISTDIYAMSGADGSFMGEALAEAQAALDHDDVPVGAVVVRDGAVIARDHNRREQTGDPTAHAEVLVLRAAADAVGSWQLTGCTLYVTLEPCVMCAGAVLNARVERVVYGAADPVAGAALSVYNTLDDPRLNHRADLTVGVRADEAAELLGRFFARRR